MQALDGQKAVSAAKSIAAAISSAVVVLALISGLFDSIERGVGVFVVVATLFLVRNLVLPKLPAWAWWSTLANKIPLVLRWVGAIATAFFVTRLVVSNPAYSPAHNLTPGAFGVEIFCFLLSLAVSLVLLPVAASASTTPQLTKSARAGAKAIVFFCIIAIGTKAAYADVCLDPFCCFGGNALLAALVVAALLLAALPFILALADLAALGALAAEAAEIAELAETAESAETTAEVLEESEAALEAENEAYEASPRLPDVTLHADGWPNLPGDEAGNFISAEPVDLPEGTTLYRIIGPSNNPGGGYWAEELPPNEAAWRSQYAVDPAWNDNGSYVEYKVGPGGLKGWQGPASSQGPGLNGGGSQFWVPPGTITPSSPIETLW